MKFYTQEQYYTCGCACFRMMLSDQGYKVPNESTIERLLGSTELTGTDYRKLIQVAKDYGMEVISKENATLEDMKDLFDKGWTIIVAYSLNLSHYSLYVGHDETFIYLCDPTFGPHTPYSLVHFMPNWEIDIKRYEAAIKEYGLILDPTANRKQWFAAFKANK